MPIYDFIAISPLEVFKRLANYDQIFVFWIRTGEMIPISEKSVSKIYSYMESSEHRFYRVSVISEGKVADLKWQ